MRRSVQAAVTVTQDEGDLYVVGDNTDDSVLVANMDRAKDLNLVVDRVAAAGGEIAVADRDFTGKAREATRRAIAKVET